MKTQILIYAKFGGFSLSQEMADYLANNKNWKIIKHQDINYNNNNYKTELKNNTLINAYNDYLHLNNDSIEYKTNPDLIECYKILKQKYTNDKKHHIHKFELIEVEVYLEIHNKYDGIEEVIVNYSKNEL